MMEEMSGKADSAAMRFAGLTDDEHLTSHILELYVDLLHRQGKDAEAKKLIDKFRDMTNDVSNLRRLGWTDADFADGGSDALIDALAVHGDAAAIGRGVTAHLEAGADHVAVQVLNPDPLPALRALAGQLQLTRR